MDDPNGVGTRTVRINDRDVEIDEDNYTTVGALVEVDLADLINGDHESFLDLLSERGFGDQLLMDISYYIETCTKYTISFRITGDVSAILEYQEEGT